MINPCAVEEPTTTTIEIIEEVRFTEKKINNNLINAENRINGKIIYSIATLVIIRPVFGWITKKD